VRPGPPPFDLGANRSICEDRRPFRLAGPITSHAYRWSTGESTQSIDIDTAGTYALTISDAAGLCIRVDSIRLSEAVAPVLPLWPARYEICPPQPEITLTAGPPDVYTYIWNNNSTAASRNINSTGQISVLLTTDSGCEGRVSTFVQPVSARFPCHRTRTASHLVSRAGWHSVASGLACGPFLFMEQQFDRIKPFCQCWWLV